MYTHLKYSSPSQFLSIQAIIFIREKSSFPNHLCRTFSTAEVLHTYGVIYCHFCQFESLHFHAQADCIVSALYCAVSDSQEGDP